MFKLEKKIVFYNPIAKISKDIFSEYIHVKDEGYWSYFDKFGQNLLFHSLYLQPFYEYPLSNYSLIKNFHIVLKDIEKKGFGYRVKFSVSLLVLGLVEADFGSPPVTANRWISFTEQNLKPHQIDQLETFFDEKSKNKYTEYVVVFGSQSALVAAEIKVDTLDEDDRTEDKEFGADYPRQVGETSFIGDIHFKNIKIARREAEEKMAQDYAKTESPTFLDEHAVFEKS